MIDVLYKSGPNLFNGWHLWYGIWVDLIRLVGIILISVVLIQVIAYWKVLSSKSEDIEDSIARSYLSLGALVALIYVGADQISRMGYNLTWRILLSYLTAGFMFFGLNGSRIFKNRKGLDKNGLTE
jgi:hypothetical protein